MFVKSFASFALLTSLVVPYASAAIVSLYFPQDNGGLPTPLTADPIGTDKSGHTTWRYAVGVSSGTFTATQGAGTSATLVAGATDFHAFGGVGATSIRADCAFATPTTSGGAVVASCAAQLADESSTLKVDEPRVTLTPIPVQVSDNLSSKSSGAGSLRMSMSGVAVSALAIIGTAGAMLVRV
ncbi:hypothetical protein LXA43DRAFT_385955 [Ganoderma leucocontextum]|nr:hypothetical protein LXA43DRAFT_385955 [Ganoderma leucocontextum]